MQVYFESVCLHTLKSRVYRKAYRVGTSYLNTITMKTFTTNLKPLITGIACAFLLLISCSATAQNKKLNDKDIAFVKSEFRQGMADFVESVKPIYKIGMTYSAFKISLLGESATTITSEGDALLLKAYNYISKSTSTHYILKNESGKELASAFRFVGLYNAENKSKNGDLILFGNTTGDTFPSDSVLNKVQDCKWYQIFCHLGNFWDWLMADTDGDGDTNLGGILDAIITICEIFGC